MIQRKTIRLLVAVAVIVVFIVSVPPLILSFPGLLFSEKLEASRIVLHSDRHIDLGMTSQLDSVSQRLTASGFFTRHEPLQIYLCHDETLTSLLDIVSGAPEGAGFHHFSGNIYLFPVRIRKFKLENDAASPEERLLLQYAYRGFNFTDLMVHEGLHQLHGDTLGIWTFRRKFPPPHWKAEGFAEYYTYASQKQQDSTYNFHERVGLYLKFREQFPLFYFKAELLYEFLSEQKQMGFSAIMDDDVTEEETFEALSLWYQGSGGDF